MTVAYHRLSQRSLDGLSAGGGDAAAIRELRAAQRSRTLLLISEILRYARASAHPDLHLIELAYRTLARVQGEAPSAVRTILDDPAVSAWALHTVRKPENPPGPGWLAAVAGAAAVRGRIDVSLSLAALDAPVALPTFGHTIGRVEQLRVVAGHSRLEWADGTATALTRPDERWRPTPDVSVTVGGAQLSARLDPLVGHRWAHGGHRTASVLDGEEIRRWQHRLASGWRALAGRHQRVAREAGVAIRSVTPLVAPASGLVSSTFRDAFGGIALSLPTDSLEAALAFAHESQHVKLTGLMAMHQLLTEVPAELFRVPWRPDPRPLDAVLHGTYAHLGVVRFWRRERQHAADRREFVNAREQYDHWLRATTAVADLLVRRPELTPIGKTIVSGMSRTLRRWNQPFG